MITQTRYWFRLLVLVAAFGMLVGFHELFSGLANARMADAVVRLISDDVQEKQRKE